MPPSTPPGANAPAELCPHCGLPATRTDQPSTCPNCGEAQPASERAKTPKAPVTPAQRKSDTDGAAKHLARVLDQVLEDCTDEAASNAYAEAVKDFNRALKAEVAADPAVARAKALRDAMDQKIESDNKNPDLTADEKDADTAAAKKAADDLAKERNDVEARIKDRIKKLGYRIFERAAACPPPMTAPAPPPPEPVPAPAPAPAPIPAPAPPVPCPPASGASSLAPSTSQSGAVAQNVLGCPDAAAPTNSLGVRVPKLAKPGKDDTGSEGTGATTGREP
ncbi:MAG TPA: hypothetical protein VN814_04680 [Caulobacteraceae bacterium]|nr:hypothetical protein [Caulobacteraceae bacterium]